MSAVTPAKTITEAERRAPMVTKLREVGNVRAGQTAEMMEDAAKAIEDLAGRVDQLRADIRDSEREHQREIREACAEVEHRTRHDEQYGTF